MKRKKNQMKRRKGSREKTMISDLPSDLVEEILSRVPLKSLRKVRLTCTKWNTLSKTDKFMKMHIGKGAAAAREGESQMIVLMDYNLFLMSIVVNGDPFTEPKDSLRLVVWDPYLGKTRWIEPRYSFRKNSRLDMYCYALGYLNKKNQSGRSHRILRFLDNLNDYDIPGCDLLWYEIYDFDSDSWTTLDVTPHWRIACIHQGVSLKGNTYWCATERNSEGLYPGHIVCFDFTKQRFGPLLPLPFSASYAIVRLSRVREDKLTVLFQNNEAKEIEIWITTKIEAGNVSWSKFLAVDMLPVFTDIRIRFINGRFFIDEEKKVAMVFEKDRDTRNRYAVNIIGEAGYFKELILRSEHADEWFLANACSYVPSFVLNQQPAGDDLEKQRYDENMSRLVALEKRINEKYMRKVVSIHNA